MENDIPSVRALLTLFDNRETTIASGIVLMNEQYDVHRFHPPLIYGRRGDAAKGEGEGIAACKVCMGCLDSCYATISDSLLQDREGREKSVWYYNLRFSDSICTSRSSIAGVL